MKKLLILFIMVGISVLIFTGCGSKNKIQPGDVVSVIYTATFSNEEIFDENTENNPLLFVVGEKQVIEGLDKAVIGMKVGKKKSITINPELGYGSLYNENLIQKIGKIIFDKLEIDPEVGTIQTLDTLEGIIRGIEMDESGNEVVLFDINPRQTWDTLTYKITILAKQE